MNGILVNTQASLFLISVIFGVASTFLYDMLRVKRRVAKTKKFIIHLEDILYWIIIAVVSFFVFIRFLNEDLRFYMVIGAFIGMTSYSATISKYVVFYVLWIVDAVIKLLKFVYVGIFSYTKKAHLPIK